MLNAPGSGEVMQQRFLGRNGLKVSALGLGCMVMSGLYGPTDEAEAIATIREALDAGANFLDTSDFYGAGHNELLVGRALADGYRGKAVLASKFGNVRLADGRTGVNGRPEHVAACCEASLARLKVEAIDLYYQHRVDPDVPIEDTVGAMQRLVEQGKVLHLGLSEAGVQTLRRASKVHPIAALQTEHSLWTRFAEAEILPACRELGIGFVPTVRSGAACSLARSPVLRTFPRATGGASIRDSPTPTSPGMRRW
jgi:aryl-alcohol dehydrogenase-like predicted oxidoreductase